MNRCLKINMIIEIKEGLLENLIRKNAQKFKIEGYAQAMDKKTVKIVACGKSDDIDSFLDALYKGHKNTKPSSLEVDPFLRDKDYRGVFRVIE